MRVNVFVDGIIGGVDEELMTAAMAVVGGDVWRMSGGFGRRRIERARAAFSGANRKGAREQW
ncbi:hypothetical protein [Burkholderia sp. MSMB1589WGS]|uniref:hypothetical protein n=1 Tax=Burkholderia sp. MSMB1589WGS TaxID=1636425 RepID=UPI0007B85991|nr:hypothetical protein [Burkholderia sp. MSMB1589WGS]